MNIAGLDEVGKGSLFGPVFAAAVVLKDNSSENLINHGLTDSKLINAKKRSSLVPLIKSASYAWGIGQSAASEIDTLGIRTATEKAMLRALHKLYISLDIILVDGSLPLRIWEGPQKNIIHGDKLCAEISAASILAKESRDALIKRLALQFPGYALERHAGYGTRIHRESIIKLGASRLHRKSFLSKILHK